jgi:hypothetical protein
LVVYEVLKVVYSPVKAFKEIVKNPNIKGPLLIFLLFLLASAGFQYVSASKFVLEIGTPEGDGWTESTVLWTPEGVSIDDEDKFVGNYSIMSFVTNNTRVWMKTTDIGSFNCSSDEGCGSLSFRIKWVHSSNMFPANTTLRLFSKNNSYFELNIDGKIANSSNTWSNVTVDIGPTNLNWRPSVDSSDWGNITGLEFELAWLARANLTMKIDHLYFGKHVPLLAMNDFPERFVSSLIFIAFGFILEWGIYAIILLLLIKLAGSEAGPLRVLFIVIGYTFCIKIVESLVNAFLFSALPPLAFPLKAWDPIAGEEGLANKLLDNIYQTNWYPTLAYNLYWSLGFAFIAWAVALSAIAIRFLREFTWKKAAGIAIVAYFVLSIFAMPILRSLLAI